MVPPVIGERARRIEEVPLYDARLRDESVID
jgi:hypothetical protein